MPSLLLTHPSLSSDPNAVSEITASLPQPVSHQMLDRLSSGAVSLPKSTYSLIRIAPSGTLLPAAIVAVLFEAVVATGKVEGVAESQNMDAIMNGFLVAPGDDDGQGGKTTAVWTRPDVQKVVLLKRRTPAAAMSPINRFTKPAAAAGPVPLSSTSSPAPSEPSASTSPSTASSSSVSSPNRQPETWTINDNDALSFDDVDDDDLIDEDTLLEGDLPDSIQIPVACQPTGKRRRKACKDCTCGLKELELEEKEARLLNQSQVFKLSLDDTAEIDFTVPGKTGSCGNCSLGDAFRCDGCPYLGLPPFKEGEVVSLDALGGDDF
ncbi:cytokine-induced anti-apoptosis inhibitor 1, Fe-S biogenesis-domain-containing protein [Lipomyces kononenkoae]